MRSPRCLPGLFTVIFCAVSCLSVAQESAPAPPLAAADTQSSEVTRSESASAAAIVPGPLRSFLRMAGISQKASADEVIPLLARNVYIQGYSNGGRPTEFLILLGRYV